MSSRPLSALSRRRFAWLGTVGASGIALGACGRPAPGGVVVFTAASPELAMAGIDPESGTWQSAPWADCAGVVRWLPYPPRGQIQLEHSLGRVPTTVFVYLSFMPTGVSPALAAGDLARVVEVDASPVTVWNDTNGSYFARVVVG
ncbi:MAG: hypothetical protein ACK6CU_09255 [Deltaproteobacteria bacterium]